MNYLYFALAVIMGAVCLTLLFWGLMILLEGYRYRKAISRRIAEIDLEMKKRGEVL